MMYGVVLYDSNNIMVKLVDINRVFTLPNTETDTETGTKTLINKTAFQ